MPKELDSCVKQVKAKGKSEESAFRICRASLGTDAAIKKRRKEKDNEHVKRLREHGLHR